MTKLACVLAVASLGLFAAGCGGGYYDDDGYGHHQRYWHDDRDSYRDRGDDGQRVRVCDADGSDCHWEYRRTP